MKTFFTILTLYLCCSFIVVDLSHAYSEDYPPFKFGSEPVKHFPMKDLAGDKPIYDDIHYKSDDSSFELKKTNPYNSFTIDNLVVKINNKTVINDNSFPHVTGFYKADFDNNGLSDYLIISIAVGNGLIAFHKGFINLFLKKEDSSYESVYFESTYPGSEDFLDINNDGVCEIIVGGYEHIVKHNYWTYNIYEIKDFRFINADLTFEGFPRFIWFTDKPNDKDTKHFAGAQRRMLTDERDTLFVYE